MKKEDFRRTDIIQIPSYSYLGGSDAVGAWIHEKWISSDVELLRENWQELKIDNLRIHNVYLSAYSSKERIDFLTLLKEQVNEAEKFSTIIVGDFNLAPNSEDGVFGDKFSDFTKEGERLAFNLLLNEKNLIDATLPNSQDRGKVFTIERNRGDEISCFRCDLCLVSKSFSKGISVCYDHNVRKGNDAFTDHSAIVLDLPQVIWDQSNKPSPLKRCDSYKTAISRSGPSQVAKRLVAYIKRELPELKVDRILDYGCGKGADLVYYENELHCKADGWDPHEPFGFSEYPCGKYDIVTCFFVLNVIPEISERYDIIKKAISYVKDNGFLLIATRSGREIESEASTKGWKTHNDGYWSSEKRCMFQKGIDPEEIMQYLAELEIKSDVKTPSELKVQSSTVVLIRPIPGE
ncbi:methyltransferase domain-containing protein [uncultured Methanomethylovorans sp.]|uniref:methyltransferase domain-containing protein n=1 Tax=uncultured Methanomethylovorans sp. TaxID=183759 RepID=UPI002AA63F86|nr:methyltransferase domain-containing protein [uncultured Methanomethylovorans sp.]